MYVSNNVKSFNTRRMGVAPPSILSPEAFVTEQSSLIGLSGSPCRGDFRKWRNGKPLHKAAQVKRNSAPNEILFSCPRGRRMASQSPL